MVANEQIKQIASRIIYMRETLELSQQDVAEKIDMPLEEYIAYETGRKGSSGEYDLLSRRRVGH